MKLILKNFLFIFISIIFSSSTLLYGAEKKSLVFIAGNSVHLWGDHENLLMCNLLKDLFSQVCKDVEIKVVDVGNNQKLSDVGTPTAVIIIGEGEANHPLKDSPEFLEKLANEKVNVGVFHYALHFSDEKDYKYLDKTIGGHYQPHWSVNPYWEANFKLNYQHPIARGVKPFTIYDEWYFNIKFDEIEGQKITPVLLAPPPDKVRKRRFGAHTGNPTVRENLGKDETIFWATENKNGTRGFGFGGGHSIWDFAHKDFRKFFVNATAWLVGIEIPENGFETLQPSYDKIEKSIKKENRRDYEDYSQRNKEFFKQNAD